MKLRTLIVTLALAVLTLTSVNADQLQTTVQTAERVLARYTLNVVDPPSAKDWLVRIASLGFADAPFQATADSIRRDTPFSVLADHDGVDTNGYNLFINTAVQQTKPVSSLVNGTISFAMANGLPRGSYTITISAFGDGGETQSSPLSLTVTAGNPAAPRNIRIVRDGGDLEQ